MHTMQLNSLMNGELFEKRYRFVFMISSLSHPKFDSKETGSVHKFLKLKKIRLPSPPINSIKNSQT